MTEPAGPGVGGASASEYRTLARSFLFLPEWYADSYALDDSAKIDLLAEFCRAGWSGPRTG